MNIKTLKTELKGRIFSATFIKKDGSIRKINCRLGVVKALRGGALKYNAEACNNLVVYDLQAKDYRTINIDKLIDNISLMNSIIDECLKMNEYYILYEYNKKCK